MAGRSLNSENLPITNLSPSTNGSSVRPLFESFGERSCFDYYRNLNKRLKESRWFASSSHSFIKGFGENSVTMGMKFGMVIVAVLLLGFSS